MKGGGSGGIRLDLKERFMCVPLSNPPTTFPPRNPFPQPPRGVWTPPLDEVWMPQEYKRRDVGSSLMGEGEAIRSEEVCKF